MPQKLIINKISQYPCHNYYTGLSTAESSNKHWNAISNKRYLRCFHFPHQILHSSAIVLIAIFSLQCEQPQP